MATLRGRGAVRLLRRASTAAVVLALFAAGCTDAAEGFRDEEGTVVAAASGSVFELQTGDCLDPDPELAGEVDLMPVVPCDQPHAQEVFAAVDLDEQPYPGAEAVARQADGACLGALETSLDLSLADGYFVSYLLPTFVGWNGEPPDRRVICVLVFPDRETAIGSVVAGTASPPISGGA